MTAHLRLFVILLIVTTGALSASACGASIDTQSPPGASSSDTPEGSVSGSDASPSQTEASNQRAQPGPGGPVPADVQAPGLSDTSTPSPEDSQASGPKDGQASGPEDSQATGPEDSQATGPEDSQATGPEDSQATGPEDSLATGPEDSSPAIDALNEADSEAPAQDVDEVEDAEVLTTLCLPGETGCDEGWVVVCGTDGEAWTPIIECAGEQACFEGVCCTGSCEGVSCGDDGCGGSCGACDEGEMCDAGSCVCAPACEGKDCGDDGCGGVCGACAEGDACLDGLCICTPDCSTAMCGDDGCGGSCGSCSEDNTCAEGVCVGPCSPGETRCNVQAIEVCGPDGETWTAIATCGEDTPCFGGLCCTPACDGMSCGDNGCGGTCGSCEGLDICVEGQCLKGCAAQGEAGCDGDMVTLCSEEGIVEFLLDCASLGQVCEEGSCVDPPPSPIPELECPEMCTGSTIDAALCALDICYADYLGDTSIYSPTGHDTTGAYGAIAHYGNAGNDLQPNQGPSYFIISSGMIAEGSTHQDSLGGAGSAPDPFATDGWDMQDAVEMSMTLTVPPNVTGFSLDFIFMSVEYEEWIGTSFNDKFYLILKGPDGVDRVINFTSCSNPEVYYDFQNEAGKWCYIAINTAFSEPCSNPTTDISGTGYECPEGSSTGWLRTTHPVTPGETFELRLHIHDTSDQIYDSAAIIDNFRWLTGEVIHETFPIPGAD